MRKVLTIFLSIGVAFLVADPVHANVIYPNTEELISGLLLFFTSVAVGIFLLPILIGLLFERRFVAIWNFFSLFVVIFILGLIFDIKNLDGASIASILLVVASALLYASFFSLVAFFASTIGRKFKKIRRIQEVFHRSPNISKILVLIVSYAFIFSPLVYVANLKPGIYTTSFIILAGIGISLLVLVFLLHRTYIKALSLPLRELTLNKKDYIYAVFLLMILIFSFLSLYYLISSSSKLKILVSIIS